MLMELAYFTPCDTSHYRSVCLQKHCLKREQREKTVQRPALLPNVISGRFIATGSSVLLMIALAKPHLFILMFKEQSNWQGTGICHLICSYYLTSKTMRRCINKGKLLQLWGAGRHFCKLKTRLNILQDYWANKHGHYLTHSVLLRFLILK